MSGRPNTDEPALFPQWIRRGSTSQKASLPGVHESQQRREPGSAAATTTGASNLRRANSCWPPPAASGSQPSSLTQPVDSSGKGASSRPSIQSSSINDYRLHRPASVPPPQHAEPLGGKFDSEFPSLRGQPEPAPPGPKDTPYRPVFLTDRVSTNWTSKLADAPVLPAAPPPSTESALTCSSSDNASATNSPTHATQSNGHAVPSGWSALASGEGHRPKLVEALTQQPASNNPAADANLFRAQLAVRQSKQLIPVLARKGDASKSSGTEPAASKATPATTLGRHTLLSPSSSVRNQSQAQEPKTASTKLVLRASRSLGGAEAAEPSTASSTSNGMLSLRKSPPGNSSGKKLLVSTTSLSTATDTPAQLATTHSSNGHSAAPTAAEQPPKATAAQSKVAVTTTAASSAPPPDQDESQSHVSSEESPSSHTWLPATSTSPPPSSQGDTTTTSTDVKPVPSSPAGAAPAVEVSGHSLPTSFTVPEEEVAFLRSLGWSDGEDEEGEEEVGLTEAEIAAFKAAAASRCTTPQLVLTPLGSRTTSPAPVASRALTGPTSGCGGHPGGFGMPRLFSVGSGLGMAGVVESAGWVVGQAHDQSVGGHQEAVAVEPLFPGVSKGWFGGLALPASPCMHSEPR